MTDSLDTSDREAEHPREPIRLPVREMRDEPAPQRAAQEGDLPPLPEPACPAYEGVCCGNYATGASYMGDTEMLCCNNPDEASPDYYTADQMREYARLALAAAGGGVPQATTEKADKMLLGIHRHLQEALRIPTMPWPDPGAHGHEATARAIHTSYCALRFKVMDAIAELTSARVELTGLLASSPQPEAAPAVANVSEVIKLAREALDIQRRTLGHGTELHLAMIDWSHRAFAALAHIDVMEPLFPEAPAQHCEHLRPMDKVCVPCRRYPNREAPAQADDGKVVVMWNHDRTRILAVTRQNTEGQILKVIAEAPAQAAPSAGEVEKLAFHLLAAANYVDVLGGDSRSYRGVLAALNQRKDKP